MARNQLLKMDVEGLEPSEAALFAEGITYPSLIVLNSHLGIERKDFRKNLLRTLQGIADEKGMMPFFISEELQRKYPPDLESTALYTCATYFAGESVPVDLDEIKKMITADNLFQTWIGKNEMPIDFTSQLIMCLSYGAAGLNVDSVLETTLKRKFRDMSTLKGRDFYYVKPLIFIYYTLFVKDKGVFPANYRSLVQQFIEEYEPTDEIEKAMIRKICRYLDFGDPDNFPTHKREPLFTNGHRRHIKYFSSAVKAVLRNSACREGIDFIR